MGLISAESANGLYNIQISSYGDALKTSATAYAFSKDDLIIACDDERVKEAAVGFGAKVVMTAKAHATGTDRICEVINPLEVRIVINIQADEPLVHPTMINSVARALTEERGIAIATIVKKITTPEALFDPNVIKVALDKSNFALYFSRATIPYHAANSDIKVPVYYKHIGLYGYTKDFLFTFKNLPPSPLEKTERLEQLRILEAGFRIKVIETQFDTIGVDTPADLTLVKEHLASHA